jgi:hypothetical protein
MKLAQRLHHRLHAVMVGRHGKQRNVFHPNCRSCCLGASAWFFVRHGKLDAPISCAIAAAKTGVITQSSATAHAIAQMELAHWVQAR